MPIYVYRCDNCEETFETMQCPSCGDVAVCPNCGAIATQRIPQPANINLKGQGWAKDGYNKTCQTKSQ